MHTNGLSIKEFLAEFEAGSFDAADLDTQISAGWYDWFCADAVLAKKTAHLVKKLNEVVDSPKIDKDKHYVFFKNNCPMDGLLYDDFRIADIKTGKMLYTVVPATGHAAKKGQAEVWSCENRFVGPIVEGTWKDVLKFFGAKQ